MPHSPFRALSAWQALQAAKQQTLNCMLGIGPDIDWFQT